MKECIVIGSGRCVWDDLARTNTVCRDVMCINDIGMHYPGPIRHWYSNDGVMLKYWHQARRPEYNKDIKLHSNNGAGGSIDPSIRVWEWVHGNSGINAVKTALALGYDKVIVCGMPLDDSGHYFDSPWGVTNYNNNSVLDDWVRYAVECRGKVISVSGNLRRILDDGDHIG